MGDELFMRRAMELAAKGEGWTAPNPMVGAVVVKDGRVIGEGYHERYGELHAERNALRSCEECPEGAAMYVTLEPCCHYGRTPPCTEAILEAKISRVVVGSSDPNPKVAGKGVGLLREGGISVEEGFLKEECDLINPVYFHYMRTGMPYVAMKYAMTADGKIAAWTGESKWITGESAREDVQRLRRKYTAIMAGIGTVAQDDPLLTCRLAGGKTPIRIICDSRLTISPDSRICKTAEETETIVAVDEAECLRVQDRTRELEAMGVKILSVPAGSRGRGLDLQALLKELGKRKIDSLLLEGGGTLNYSMLAAGMVNRVYAYIAPKIFGGAEAKTPVEGMGVSHPSEAFHMERTDIRLLGEDIRLRYDSVKPFSGEEEDLCSRG